MKLKTGEIVKIQVGTNLTFKEIESLINQINREQNILTTRVTVENLAELSDQKLVSIIRNFAGEIIANGILWPTKTKDNSDDIWYELGSCWVQNNYRKMHLGTELLKQIVENKPKNANIFLASSNPIIHEIANQLGFISKNKQTFAKCEVKPYFKESEKLFVLENMHN